jgi:hypothetical protein
MFHACKYAMLGWVLIGIHGVSGEESSTPTTPEDWVAMLGATEFAKRELATARLVEAGPDVLELLIAARRHSDPEVRARAELIHAKVAKDWFEERANRFLANTSSGDDLPGWGHAKKLLADSVATRRMFVDLSREYPEFVESLALPPPARRVAAERVAERSLQAQHAQQLPKQADLIALLMTVADDEVELTDVIHRRIVQLTSLSVFSEAVNSSVFGKKTQELAGIWVLKAPEFLSSYAIQVAIDKKLPEGLIYCRKLLKPGAAIEVLQNACRGICELGSIDDLPIFEPLLSDRREVFRLIEGESVSPEGPRQPVKQELRIGQVRDFILAAALWRGGVKPQEAGFLYTPSTARKFQLDSQIDLYCFANDDQREVPLTKFRELLKAQQDK